MQCCGTSLLIFGTLFQQHTFEELIPVEVQSKVWVCTVLIAGIAGSSPGQNTGFRLLCLLGVAYVAAIATS